MTVVVDELVNVELTLGVELMTVEEMRLLEELMDELALTVELTELLAEALGVGVGVADETEELLLDGSVARTMLIYPPGDVRPLHTTLRSRA